MKEANIVDVRNFAYAISRCNKVLGIDANNNGIPNRKLKRMLLSGSSFAVLPTSDTLAVDFDEPGILEKDFIDLNTALCLRGLEPVICASGREGHRHLFCKMRDAAQAVEFKAWLKERGHASWVRNSYIRPPLSPHRQGLKVAILSHENPEDALMALRGDDPMLKLGPRTIAKIVDAEGLGTQFASGSELTQSILSSCYLKGVTFEQIFPILLRADHRGGVALRKRIRFRGYAKAKIWLSKSYEKASRYLANRDTVNVLEIADYYWARVMTIPNQTRRRSTLRKVMAAHAKIAVAAQSLTYTASLRQIAEESGITSLRTVTKAHSILRANKYLVQNKRGIGTMATTWSIPKPSPTALAEHCAQIDTLDHLGGCGASVSICTYSTEDAFRTSYEGRRGLGGLAGILLEVMHGREGARIVQICRITGFSRTGVVGAMKRLEAQHMAKRDGFLWSVAGAIDRAIEAYERLVGLLGARERQHLKHVGERESYMEWRAAYLV